MKLTKYKHNIFVYLKYAIMHPWHVVLFAGATVFGVAHWSLVVLFSIFISAEILLHLIVMNLKSFHDYVDERIAMIEKEKAAEKRASIFIKMPDTNRREFLRLEQLIYKMQERLSNYSEIAKVIADDCHELLKQYIVLSINSSHFSLDEIEKKRESIIKTIKVLNSVPETPYNINRLEVASQRLTSLDKVESFLRDSSAQLSTISDVVELKIEQALLPGSLPSNTEVRVDIDNIAEEIAEFDYVEDVDMDAIKLGRAEN